jgi:tetratricopeptide (TPR) repeat protein
MKKIFIFIILIFININFLYAEDRNSELNRLFEELKIKDKSLSFKIEQKIWKIWSTHPDNNELTSMLSIGSDFVNNNQYLSAVEIFTKVIEIDPSWAEAWNKRATVLYMMGEFEKSQNDIDEVLKLEKRHFGALAGQGLVNIKLENYEKAIMSYEEAMKIYPSMNSPKIMIKEIKELIKNQSI